MSDCSSSLFRGTKDPKISKHVPLNWGDDGGWAVEWEATQHTAAPQCLRVCSLKQVALAERSDVCKAWRTHLGEHNLLCTGREWKLNNMLDSTSFRWEVVYKCYVCWTHFSTSKAERNQREQVRSSASSGKNLIAAAFLFLLLSSAFWARIFRDSYLNTKSFVTQLFKGYMSPLCPSQ